MNGYGNVHLNVPKQHFMEKNVSVSVNNILHHHIAGFTMYTTCVIWLAFVPLYFGTASHVPLRVTSMAVTISLSATVTLACLFAPKVTTEVLSLL